MATDYGMGMLPRIVRTFDGRKVEERSTIKLVVKDSTTLYLGQFVNFLYGTDAAPTTTAPGIDEMGLGGYTQTKGILGYVKGIQKQNGSLPIQDDTNRVGTFTDANLAANVPVPWKYQFSATNDESNTTSAALEMAEIMPIVPGDILTVALVNSAGTAMANRGDTTAAGTTGSSANIFVGLRVHATYPFLLNEASASTTLTSMDFVTIYPDGKRPEQSNRVYVTPLAPVIHRQMA